MTAYFDELCKAMKLLADAGAVVVGQTAQAPGTAMHGTLKDFPQEQRLEFMVAENMQLGFCTGIALAGKLPLSIYPRINFFIEALPQLVQHLDKIPLFSDYKPKVIIRTAIATDKPLDPGAQHKGDYTAAIEQMLSTVKVVKLTEASQIVPSYQAALERDGSTLLVEDLSKY